MSTPDIRLVLFDIGNVIIRATHAITHAILEDYGLASDVARKFFANDDYVAYARGTITSFDFAEQILSFHCPSIPYEAVRTAHDAHIYAVDKGVVATLEKLRIGHVPIALATNTNRWQTARERELIDLSEFTAKPQWVFRSDEMGMLKTDPGAFERILTALGEEPAHVLFIDDSEKNTAAAAALGMPTIRFLNAAQLRASLVTFGLLD